MVSEFFKKPQSEKMDENMVKSDFAVGNRPARTPFDEIRFGAHYKMNYVPFKL